MLLYNAKIYTLDDSHPTASAIVVDRGEVLGVGTEAELRRDFPGHAVEDLGGRTVLPGLTDAHLHLEHYALGLQKIDCETATRVECLERVAERARKTPPGNWVLGHGWNQNNWPEGFGTAEDLDRAAPQLPVYLTAKSLHAAWANTAALRLAGLATGPEAGPPPPDPAGGRLGRRPDGYPDGILFESAMELVGAAVPEPTPEQVAEAIRLAQPVLWRMGLTGVHDFDRSRCFAALQMLHERGELGLRVLKSIPLEDLPHAAGLGLRSGFGDDWLRIGGVKAFADGALGPQTAAMLQPYEGGQADKGMLLMDAEELFEHGREAVRSGFSLAVHAIGDRANHEVLDAYAQLRRFERENGLPARRHRIEHVQLIHPDDAGRLAALGVVASMQPIHATSDMLTADQYWGDRAAWSYAWRVQLDRGAALAFGSDAPVESPNPFWGLYAAVTRRRADGAPGPEGWRAEQKLSLKEAWQGFTTGPAYTAGQERRQGRLARGYLADLIALDADPFEAPAEALLEMQAAGTMIGGEWVQRVF